MPHARIPNTDEKHSFFIDLKSTDASEEEVLAAITLDGIVGVHSRDDRWVVEFMCKNDAVVEAAIKTPFLIKDRKPVEAIWPRHKTNKHVVIKVANVPILSYAELIERIHHQWKQYGTVIDARPYTFPGKPWLTKRWDVLLQLPERVNKLDASPVFQFDGYTDVMVCSWNFAFFISDTWYAPGPVLRRLAFDAKLPATPPPNVWHKNQKIKKLGSWQTPSRRSAESDKTKKGRIRGRKFYRVTRKKLRPLHQPLHQPLNQPHSPHQPLWLHRSLLLRDTSLWQRRLPPPTHRPILLCYPRQLFWGRSCSSQGRQHPLHHLFLFRTQTRLTRGISVVLKMMNNGPLL